MFFYNGTNFTIEDPIKHLKGRKAVFDENGFGRRKISQSQSGNRRVNTIASTRQKTKIIVPSKRSKTTEITCDREPNNSDPKVVAHRIYDFVRDLGQNNRSVHDTVLDLVKLATAVDNNQLATKETLPSEESGHNKEYIAKMIFDISAALGSRTATVSETISKLVALANLLLDPSPKVPPVEQALPTKTEAPKGKIPDPAEAPGPEPTVADATDIKGDGVKTDGIAQKSDPLDGKGKGKGKKKAIHQGAEGSEERLKRTDQGAEGSEEKQKPTGQGAEGSEEKLKPTGQGAEGSEKKLKPTDQGVEGSEERQKPTGQGAEGSEEKQKPTGQGAEGSEKKPKPTGQVAEGSEGKTTLNVPGKTGASVASVANEEKVGKKSVTPAAANRNDILVASGAVKSESSPLTAPLLPGKTLPKVVTTLPIPNANVAAKVEDANVQGGVFELKLRMNLPGGETSPTNQSLDRTVSDAMGLLTTAKSLFSAAAPAAQSGENEQVPQPTQAQQALFTESQARPPAQQTPRVGETGNPRETGYINFAEAETQFPVRPTPRISETGNRHEIRYRNLAEQQTQFPCQQFPQATETHNSHEFVNYHDAESQNPIPPRQMQQAGEPRIVDEYSRYYSTISQDPSLQPHPQGYLNGTSAMHNRETLEKNQKPYISVPLTNTKGGIPGPTFNHTQIPNNERYPHSDPTLLPAYSSPHKLTRLQPNLPGSYYQDDLSDSSGSFSSSGSTAADNKFTRDKSRGPNDRDELNDLDKVNYRGGHDPRRSRHERSDRHNSDRVSSRRADSYPNEHRRDESEEKFYRREYRPRRDKARTKTAPSEDLNTSRSRRPHQSSSGRSEPQQSFWANVNRFAFGHT